MIRKTLTSATGFKLKDGTPLSCNIPEGYYIGVLSLRFGTPIFRTYAHGDGYPDSWEISDWSRYALATDKEYVLWKLEH